jgi:hypothetical protein
VITVWAVNTAVPPASNSTSFTAVVADCVQVSIGYGVVQTGQRASMPLNLLSTVGLSNLSFTLAYPSGYLTNWMLALSNSFIGPRAILLLNPSQTGFNLPANRGQTLQGASQLGSIGFSALAGPSAFVPLAATGILATRSDGSIFTNGIGQPGRVVVIGPQPLLDAWLSNNVKPMLTLYGNPPDTYQISSSTNVTGTVVWTPFTNITLTNIFEIFSPPSSTNQMEFFRAMQESRPPLAKITGVRQNRGVFGSGDWGARVTLAPAPLFFGRRRRPANAALKMLSDECVGLNRIDQHRVEAIPCANQRHNYENNICSPRVRRLCGHRDYRFFLRQCRFNRRAAANQPAPSGT